MPKPTLPVPKASGPGLSRPDEGMPSYREPIEYAFSGHELLCLKVEVGVKLCYESSFCLSWAVSVWASVFEVVCFGLNVEDVCPVAPTEALSLGVLRHEHESTSTSLGGQKMYSTEISYTGRGNPSVWAPSVTVLAVRILELLG